MLILSRHLYQSVVIGHDVTLTVVGIGAREATFEVDSPQTRDNPTTVRCAVNEYFDVAEDVTVLLVSVRRDKVRIGFDVPKDVPIHRGESYETVASGRYEMYGSSD